MAPEEEDAAREDDKRQDQDMNDEAAAEYMHDD